MELSLKQNSRIQIKEFIEEREVSSVQMKSVYRASSLV